MLSFVGMLALFLPAASASMSKQGVEELLVKMLHDC